MEPKIEIQDIKRKEKGKLLAQFKAKVTFGDGPDAPAITLPKMSLIEFPKGKGVDASILKSFQGKDKMVYVKAFYPNKTLNALITVQAVKAYEALPPKVVKEAKKKGKGTDKA